MCDALPQKQIDALLTPGFVSIETLNEYRVTIERLISNLERNLRKELGRQELEFQKAFNDQMRIVQDKFGELKLKMEKLLSREQTEKKFATLHLEKNFFMDHSLFLNEQNRKLTERAKELRECLQNTISERDFYKGLSTQLRQQLEGDEKKEEGAVRFKIVSKIVPSDICRQIFGRQSINFRKENEQPAVVETAREGETDCERLTNRLQAISKRDSFFKKSSVVKQGTSESSHTNKDFFVTTKCRFLNGSAGPQNRKMSVQHPGLTNSVWNKMGQHERIKIRNVLRAKDDCKDSNLISEALMKSVSKMNSAGCRAFERKKEDGINAVG